MKLILTQEVTGLGEPGDIIDVKDGYGRNYLLPRGLATGWSKGGEKQVAQIRAARRVREVATLEEAQALKASLERGSVRLVSRSGPGGRLFGAVTPADVATAVQGTRGTMIDRRKVEMRPIRSIGSYQVQVRLHSEVSATIDLEVVPER